MPDEKMKAKQRKAQQYANEPGRFTLLNMQIEVKTENGNLHKSTSRLI
jgi:hypothetical protein